MVLVQDRNSLIRPVLQGASRDLICIAVTVLGFVAVEGLAFEKPCVREEVVHPRICSAALNIWSEQPHDLIKASLAIV